MSMKNFHIFGYDTAKKFDKSSDTDSFFALIKVITIKVFKPILIMFN